MLRSDRLFPPVLAALAADPATDFGAPGATVDVVGRIDGPYSSVRRVRIRTAARTLHAYVKVMAPRRPGDDELARIERVLRREFKATSDFHRAFAGDDDIRTVRPIALLAEHHALVTEEVPGRPFGELLADPSRSAAPLTVVAARVGAWVRAYQSTVAASGEIALSERRAYLDQRLKLLEGRVLTSAEAAATLAEFDALSLELGVDSVPAVAIHADLTPMNIVVDPQGRVAVLDFTMAKIGTEHHDLSHLCFHLDMLAAKRRSRRAEIDAVTQAMLAGWHAELSVDDPLFRLMMLQHRVCHVAMLAERRFPVGDAAYRWYLKHRWQVCERIRPTSPHRQVA